MPDREGIIASHGDQASQRLGERYWVDLSFPLIPCGVRLFHLRSLETGETAIIAVPEEKQVP
jgi:hypothetical protein